MKFSQVILIAEVILPGAVNTEAPETGSRDNLQD
jgi:hypothetical protein